MNKSQPENKLLMFVIIAILVYLAFSMVANEQTRLKSAKMAKTFANIKSVCLDPGHGGADDPGAQNGELVEKEINLDVANSVKIILENKGYAVYLTRADNNTALTNNERADYCNAKGANILVSIHHNDYVDSSVDYSTVLFYKDSDVKLAQSILSSNSTALNLLNNGMDTLEDNVLMSSKMPSSLSEAFFISNSEEAYLINNSNRLNEEADSISSGIINYFQSQND